MRKKKEREREVKEFYSLKPRARGALIRLLGSIPCELKWDILTFNMLHGILLTDVHFV